MEIKQEQGVSLTDYGIMGQSVDPDYSKALKYK